MQNTRPCILVVDDDPAVLTLVAQIGASENLDVATARSVLHAVQQQRARRVDLVLVDARMPGAAGLDALAALKQGSSLARVALMADGGTIERAVTAIKHGATDYLTKPIEPFRLRQVLHAVRLEWEGAAGAAPVDATQVEFEFCGMVGRSAVMKDVFSLLRRLAPHVRTALITGETGSGKELAARALHSLGPRSHRRLVTVNCSAVVETLFESELFGHVRGAFTGATADKVGLFEAADGGTLFLDEVGELPPGAQAKLLRVLEDGDVQRVGSLEPRRVDVRVIAATNRDLHAEMAAGRFRSDLFYRLNVVEVHLPPLRDRRDDIVSLAGSFVRSCGRKLGKALAGLTAGAEALLVAAEWEGNVRQLRNAIERACILADGGVVTELDLANGMGRGRSAPTDPERRFATVVQMPPRATPRLSEVEREHIVRVLAQVGGNKALAARLLGVSRRAFYRQLERHGLHHRVPVRGAGVAGRMSALDRAS